VRLHHLNLTSMNPQAMWDFYVTKLGLEDDPDHWMSPGAWDENRFCRSGDIEFHLSSIDPGMSVRFGKALNPLLMNGHIAFLVDDIDAAKARLDSHAVPYADYGIELGGKWEQVFVADPRGAIVELRCLTKRQDI
jgi:catechol 2,3-dioxygenase-like lactoylglutathione lyase family enzyme